MSDPLENISGVFDELVNQFSDPLAFFRELIQNSIDAGSQQIEIWFEYKADASGDGGLAIAHIDDFGEGMTRDIIENKLTRLFSSTKDDDFTKIGRFGIGFVSVFAVEPNAVVLDTARGGEAWRVIFHPDRTYDLIALENPVEGTQIQVIKSMSYEDFEDFQTRASDAIKTWCKHVSVPIFVSGTDVRQDFDVDSICKVTHEEEGTRVVMGFVPGVTDFGFYNRGLTLMEGHERWFPCVSFKIDSRYLEHTLTRDQVLEDRHFHKAKSLLEELATKRLPGHLFKLLGEAAKNKDTKQYNKLITLLVRAYNAGQIILADHADAPMLPVSGGEIISLKTAKARFKKNQLFLASGGRHMATGERQIVDTTHTTELKTVLWGYFETEPVYIESRFVQPADVDATGIAGAGALVGAMAQLMKNVTGEPAWIGFGDLTYHGCPFEERVALVTPDALNPVPLTRIPTTTIESLATARHVVLNVYEPRVVNAIEIARDEPEFAAMQLLKIMVVEHGLPAEFCDAITDATLAARNARLGAA